MKELERILDSCFVKKIPVIMVVVIFGTTEEGSIDPIDAVVEMRESFKKLVYTYATPFRARAMFN